jgi:hypothetical protein
MAKRKNNFLVEAKNYGIKRILLSAPPVISLAFAIFFFCQGELGQLSENFQKDVATQVQSIGVGVFAILFAAFAIVISLSEENFVRFLQKRKVFRQILFPFWFNSGLYLLAVIGSFISSWFPETVSFVILSVSVWLVLWALFETFYVIMAAVLFGTYRAQFIEYRKEIEEELAREEQSSHSQINPSTPTPPHSRSP